MAPGSSSRIWKKYYQKTKTRKIRHSIKFQIQKIQKSKEGVNSYFLSKTLNGVKNFIGAFPQDFLFNKNFTTPVSLIINLDVSSQTGSHWIALYLDDSNIEVFDSLGLDPKSWLRKPTILLNFIHKNSRNRKLRITRKLQSDKSNLCGVFCLFFILARTVFSFREICNFFTSDLTINQKLLLNFFK